MGLLKNGEGICWPDGKRIAVVLSFDFDAEYLRYSVIGKKKIGFSDFSRGQYGVDEGLNRCLDMLKRQDIETTFFIPGKVAEKYGDKVQAIAEGGHELAYHGYEHDNDVMISSEKEEENMKRSEALLEGIGGQKILGYRGPLDTLPECSFPLMQKRGYLYDSTLKDCDWAYVIDDGKGAPVVELPSDVAIDDFSYYYFSYADEHTITCSYPNEYVCNMWKDYFTELAAEGDKIMILKLHPQLIGRSSRIRMVEQFILYMKQNGAWITSCKELAQYVLDDYLKRKEAE